MWTFKKKVRFCTLQIRFCGYQMKRHHYHLYWKKTVRNVWNFPFWKHFCRCIQLFIPPYCGRGAIMITINEFLSLVCGVPSLQWGGEGGEGTPIYSYIWNNWLVQGKYSSNPSPSLPPPVLIHSKYISNSFSKYLEFQENFSFKDENSVFASEDLLQ